MIDRLIDCTGPWSGKVQDSLCREQRLLKAQNCHAKPMHPFFCVGTRTNFISLKVFWCHRNRLSNQFVMFYFHVILRDTDVCFVIMQVILIRCPQAICQEDCFFLYFTWNIEISKLKLTNIYNTVRVVSYSNNFSFPKQRILMYMSALSMWHIYWGLASRVRDEVGRYSWLNKMD